MPRLVLLLVVLGLAFPAAAQTPTAPEAYRLDVLTPASMYAFSPDRPAFLPGSRTWTATLDGKRISENRFYDVVGRSDMARAAGRRRNVVAGLTGVGIAAATVGVLLIAQGTPTLRECRQRRGNSGSGSSADFTTCEGFDPALTIGGTALVLGGVVSISFALPMTKRALPARDAAAEARRFNGDSL